MNYPTNIQRNPVIDAIHSWWHQWLSAIYAVDLYYVMNHPRAYKDTTRYFHAIQELVKFVIRIFIVELPCH